LGGRQVAQNFAGGAHVPSSGMCAAWDVGSKTDSWLILIYCWHILLI